MKLLYIVQRYGSDIVGGSEAACRSFAEALVARGHDVEVLTSCARSYVDWADSYEAGTATFGGVTIHRLPVVEARRPERFGPMDMWLMSESSSPMLFEHQRWAKLMGPDIDGFAGWLIDNARRFDACIFMTYLYTTATTGIPAIAGRIPVVFQPTAHDEPAIRVPLYESIFRLADSYLFFTPEEETVVRERFRFDPVGEVVGIGIDLDPPVGSIAEFRNAHGLGDAPYLVYVGRLDPMKGVKQLCDFFISMKRLNDVPLKLVLAGDPLVDLPEHDDIVITGFLDEPVKHAAIRGSLALVQCSYFESFSIVLCEAWVQHRPALVQGACTVLRGQALRSAGAIPYEGFAEFEQAVMMLWENESLAESMGRNGRRYVEELYDWDKVIDGVERTLEVAIERFASREMRMH